MNYRVRLNDPMNWVIEKFNPGGSIIVRGKHAGKTSVPRWTVVGFYPNMQHAYEALLSKNAGDKLLNEGKEILLAIKESKLEILNAIQQLKESNNASNVS